MIKTSTPGILKNTKCLMVCDSALPGNAQEPAELAEVELVQFLGVSPVACPGLAAIQQGWEDYSSVDSNLRCLHETELTPNSCRQVLKCAAGLRQSTRDILQCSSVDLDRWLWLSGARGCLAEYLGFLNADCQAEGLDSSGETVSQALQVLFGVSSHCIIVRKQEVADQSFLHFGVGFQSSQIE